MKYNVDSIKMSETKEVDISEYIPSATEPVKIKIKHLTTKKRNEVIALMMKGQELSTGVSGTGGGEGNTIEIKNTEWFTEARKIELLNGVLVDDNFPFEKWDEQFIDEIDQRCPELIQYLQDEIQEFNRPLAEKNNEK